MCSIPDFVGEFRHRIENISDSLRRQNRLVENEIRLPVND